MRLTIDGTTFNLEPLDAFRDQHQLPAEFGVAYFEPGSWEAQGALDASALAGVREAVLRGAPVRVRLAELPAQVEALSGLFRRELQAVAGRIDLRMHDVDFAAAGLHALLLASTDRLVRLLRAERVLPGELVGAFDFEPVYQGWLDDSARFSAVTHAYPAPEGEYRVRLMYYAYGRVGLEVRGADEVHYLLDTCLACPAEDFMHQLSRDASQALAVALAAGEAG